MKLLRKIILFSLYLFITTKILAQDSLNNTNTVSFKVYVTDLGNYSVYTKKNNGIMFGTSGEFSQLGEQTIVLTGSGVPTSGGTFIFAPAIIGPAPRGGNYCGFPLRVQ